MKVSRILNPLQSQIVGTLCQFSSSKDQDKIVIKSVSLPRLCWMNFIAIEKGVCKLSLLGEQDLTWENEICLTEYV